MRLALGPHLDAAVEARLAGLDADRLVARMWRRDPTLWSAHPARHGAIAGRLGWLALPEAMEREVAALREFAAGVVAEGFTHAVLLGMGGSSLAPEVLRLTLGVRPGFLALTVLDDTSPAAVAAVADAHDPARTLFIVSSKSGSTLEVVSFERHFFAWVRAARGDGAGRAFVAITDPGTPLERLARERGYRRVFSGAPDVGGRYSALSPFGLLPAALIGADLDRLLAGARAELAPLGAWGAAREVPGVRLGAALGELALRGRGKLTLLLDAPFAAFGAWVEQLIAESTGKEGEGIVPVVEESLAAPDLYSEDRVFAVLGAFDGARETARSIAALESAGHPVFEWDPGEHGLGAEFVRWEIATATAAAILGVNPFDEPNVTEAKQATQSMLEGYLVSGRFPADPPVAAAHGLEAHAPAGVVAAVRPHLAAPADPAAWVPALLALARPGDYLALLAYLHRTPARHQRLQRLRERLRAVGRLATTLGYGPRYLHSTGQLHKGGPASGIFLLLTADPGPDRGIPDERFGFAVLHRAQAEGDYAALERRDRRLLRIHLGADAEAGLDALIAAV
ncbi:MAG: transaldolase, partial [Candidatus Eisenbacteria bacterium]